MARNTALEDILDKKTARPIVVCVWFSIEDAELTSEK